MENMVNLEPNFVGFFPKQSFHDSPFENHGITDICSVSECIRSGLKDWIDLWKHNDLGFYDDESIVRGILQEDLKQYTVFAYRLFLFCYENGELRTEGKMISRAKKMNIPEDLTNYTFVGLDVVSCSDSDFFECSALSCNNAFEKFKVNEYCLLEDLDYAMIAQKEISKGNYEPGEQYLLEVYRRIRAL